MSEQNIPKKISDNISPAELECFKKLTSINLNDQATFLAGVPSQLAPKEQELMALHWHPEWVPIELIESRIHKAFPVATNSLVIPTQHNQVLTSGAYAGVEADVYAKNYGQKVQLLIHFKADKMPKAGVFIKMMERTYNYRAHQLMEILDALIGPGAACELSTAAVSMEAVKLACLYAHKLKFLILEHKILGSEADELLKNRLLTDFIGGSAKNFSPELVGQALAHINAVKKGVKSQMRPEQFYSPEEVIEEARSLGAGVIIPHPPKFWPILLSELDVDGWEVWNPSTPKHTIFLIEALKRHNETHAKKLLAFMGDDTHMSAKIRENYGTEKKGAEREIGFQPPWADPIVAKSLKEAGQSRQKSLDAYRRILEK